MSEFFRDLDVVPSDIVAGVILVRKLQRMRRDMIVSKTLTTYRFLSGIQITQYTKFLDVTDPITSELVRDLIHFLHYAIAIYGWPLYVMNNAAGCCKLCPYLRCGACVGHSRVSNCVRGQQEVSPSRMRYPLATDDNCCECNQAALKKVCEDQDFEVIYVSYHDSVGEPPFSVTVDYLKQAIVVAVRGTLSLHDVLTDLNAEGDLLPVNPRRDNWLGHKGIIEAAQYINKQLTDRGVLQQAFYHNVDRGTPTFKVVLVGHSLGAGTVSILAIMLKEQYPNLVCFAYSPPGGLLSLPAIEHSKSFITSVVLGKDVVPRLGLHQMESLRYDLIAAIKRCDEPKWKVIGHGFHCRCGRRDDEPEAMSDQECEEMFQLLASREKALSDNPQDESVCLTVHQPLYPPGRVIHIVRSHPDKTFGR